MTRPPVIVTGGAGYIGSHTCKALAQRGYLPIAVDDLRTGHADAVRWGPLEQLDLAETDRLTEVIARSGARTVIHFAASAYVGESMREPLRYYTNNVATTVSLLRAMERCDVTRMIFSSSCATYGIPDRMPIAESTSQHPVNPYGRTKLMCEEIIRDHFNAVGGQFALLRYFNAAGADPMGQLSERHDPETHLIPLALMAAAGLRPPLEVFGTDYDTPDGTCIRDYIHVSDLARAHVCALEHLSNGAGALALNLGTGEGLSILEIADAIERLTGRPMPWSPAPRRAGDPPILVADPRAAREVLGFCPRLSDIDTILRHAAPQFGLEVRHARVA
jgi:UDP-arabinose 4-epimerase